MPHAQVGKSHRGRAKQLRRTMTRAEVLLWRHLKAHRLSGLGFRRQTPIGNYIVDFRTLASSSSSSTERVTTLSRAFVVMLCEIGGLNCADFGFFDLATRMC